MSALADASTVEDLDLRELPRPWLTAGLAVVMAVLFVLTWASDGWPLWEGAGRLSYDTLLGWGGCEVVAVWLDGEWWRVATANLLHGAWWHAGLNIWAWLGLGAWVEGSFSWRALARVSLASGIVSTCAALAFSSSPMVVGVSGVIFGLGGYLWARREDPGLGSFPVRSLVFWFGLTLGLGLVWDGLSQAGHLGGLAAGLLVGQVEERTRRGASTARVARFARAIGTGEHTGDAVPKGTLLSPQNVVFVCLVAFAGALGWSGQRRDAGYLAQTWAWVAREDYGLAATRMLNEVESRGVDEARVDADAANEVAYRFALDGERLEIAEALADLALELRPGNPNMLDTRGWVACRRGREAEGVEFVRLALEAGATSDEVRAHLRDCADAGISESGAAGGQDP